MKIKVCDREMDVDDTHASLLDDIARKAFIDHKRVYTAGKILVPFEHVVSMLDMRDKDLDYRHP